VPGDEGGKLEAYAALVRRWSARLDLLSPAALLTLEERHVRDCLRLAPLVRELAPGTAVDVGSGAGLPGIVLAIVGPLRWRLLEPNRRKAAFLEEVARTLSLECEVLTLRAEEAARDPGLASAHVLATARALAPPATALVTPGGMCLTFAGKRAEIPAEAELWDEGVAIIRREGLGDLGERGSE
jgi:16S rRNA (guanine527-N7)-methyltransferase